MNEREISLVKAVSEACGEALSAARKEFRDALFLQKQVAEEQYKALQETIQQISARLVKAENAKVPEHDELVRDVLARITLPDIPQMVSEAVAALPPAQDGKSVTVDDVRPLLQELVKAAVPDVKSLVADAVADIPPPAAGKPGEDGRDALALELLPCIDEEKSYPRGSYATHNGGLWRAYEKTCGLRGWECIVDGVADVDIEHNDLRSFSITLSRSSGRIEQKRFDVPVMLYRGVFSAGDEYNPGDTVTWGGSLWHCDTATADKPGETGSKGWTLAAKRGRDGKDKT